MPATAADQMRTVGVQVGSAAGAAQKCEMVGQRVSVRFAFHQGILHQADPHLGRGSGQHGTVRVAGVILQSVGSGS